MQKKTGVVSGGQGSIDEVLRSKFRLESFRPGQRQVIEALLERKAALAVFPTGGGKSLCYQLPALMFEGVTLVVSPLIALMKDQIDALAALGIPAARLDSSLSDVEAREVTQRIKPGGDLKLLYVAPERFNNERFVAMLKGTRISLFAVDEAHCVSEWGHNFRPDYLKLAEFARTLNAERVLALTATATPEVAKDICGRFAIPPEAAVVTGFYRPNLELWISPCAASERASRLIARLRERPPGSTIVYVTLQKTAEELAARLHDARLPAQAYHAGLDAEVRANVQDWWMKSDRGIVVATIAFGMGIDKANVRYVYHYNLPKSLESYSQEIGRAGRDGRPSVVELFAAGEDLPTLENFAWGDTPDRESLRALVEHLAGLGPGFDISQFELSGRFDIRPLVLRTAFTYLELDGVLRQGTPFYRQVEFKELIDWRHIYGRFDEQRGRFVRDIVGCARKGRTWYALSPDEAAQKLKQDRERLMKALDYLRDQGLIELRPSELRHRFTVTGSFEPLDAIVTSLEQRFATRETHELVRLQQVVQLLDEPGCKTNALLRHFGERLANPCQHCSWCAGERPKPVQVESPSIPASFDWASVDALRRSHPQALGTSRQLARFLCGLTSPALTKAKLSRNKLFGALEDRPFAKVLEACETRLKRAA